MKGLTEGSKAPGFTLPTDGGGSVSLADFAGQTLVLYFYPKDDTEGCTKEAIGFSEQIEAFREAGASILGVSRDSVAAHDKFKKKKALAITLGSDETGSVTESYGVWVEKSMYGRTYMGIERATFLIDGSGTIRRIWRKVRVAGHVADVLQAARSLA